MTIETDNEIKRIGMVWSYVAHRSSWELGFDLFGQYLYIEITRIC